MKFEDFDNKHEKEKRVILCIAIPTVLILVIVLLLISSLKVNNFIKINEFSDSSLLEKDVCLLGFKSIVTKKGSDLFVVRDYLKSIESANYEMIDFEYSDEDLRFLKSENSKCKIILSSNNDQGLSLRSFQVTLDQDNSYDFVYKVKFITETVLEDSDREESI